MSARVADLANMKMSEPMDTVGQVLPTPARPGRGRSMRNVRLEPDEAADCADGCADIGNDIECWLEDQCVGHDLYDAAAAALGVHVDEQDCLTVMIESKLAARSDLSARQRFVAYCQMGRQTVIAKAESTEWMASPAVAQEALCSR